MISLQPVIWSVLVPTTKSDRAGGAKTLFLLLQSPNHLHNPFLNSLQELHVSLVERSWELETVSQMQPHQGWVEGEDHLTWTAGLLSCPCPEDGAGAKRSNTKSLLFNRSNLQLKPFVTLKISPCCSSDDFPSFSWGFCDSHAISIRLHSPFQSFWAK